jgi:hypothetical protein
LVLEICLGFEIWLFGISGLIAMPFGRSASARELATRVQIDFHKRPNRLRRFAWTVAVLCGLGAVVWLAAEAVQGERRVYQADRVATPHRMFENDCAQCHGGAEWQPVRRLLELDDSVRSVTNENCLRCHEGPVHHVDQIPSHDLLSCAECHREHEGDQMLAWVADRHCVRCHGSLQTITGPSDAFVRRIESFDGAPEDGGHPEFAIQRLLELDSPELPPGEAIGLVHAEQPIVSWFQREGDAAPRWQDSARIRFNHKVHLHAKYENGRLVEGLRGPDRELRDYSQNCTACHEFDAARRYMQPINYERHCAECHPLYFDVEQHAGQTVPHERPELVRGYLTELYTLQALSEAGGDEPGGGEAGADGGPPARPLPGRPSRAQLAASQAADVQSRVAAAEQTVLDHTHQLFGQEKSAGGCRYCHEVERAEAAGAAGAFEWAVVPPRIPVRWLEHSIFRHDSHRMLGCVECHQNLENGTSVLASESTGDVLIPSIERCQQCHTRQHHSNGQGTWARFGGARTDCVECHLYHNHSEENFNGPLTISLSRRAMPNDEARTTKE